MLRGLRGAAAVGGRRPLRSQGGEFAGASGSSSRVLVSCRPGNGMLVGFMRRFLAWPPAPTARQGGRGLCFIRGEAQQRPRPRSLAFFVGAGMLEVRRQNALCPEGQEVLHLQAGAGDGLLHSGAGKLHALLWVTRDCHHPEHLYFRCRDSCTPPASAQLAASSLQPRSNCAPMSHAEVWRRGGRLATRCGLTTCSTRGSTTTGSTSSSCA